MKTNFHPMLTQLLIRFSTSSTKFLSYNSYPLQSHHLYELQIQDIERSHSLVSHKILPPLSLFLLFLNLHSMYSVLVLLNIKRFDSKISYQIFNLTLTTLLVSIEWLHIMLAVNLPLLLFLGLGLTMNMWHWA